MTRRRAALQQLRAAADAARREQERGAVPDDVVVIEETVAALAALLPLLRAARLDAAILAAVARDPAASCNGIALAVTGERARVLSRIRVLQERGLLRRGPRAGRWFGTSTGSGLPTTPGQRLA